MKTKKFIVAELVKSNKSKNFVWVVYTNKKEKHFCKNAASALKFAFILKKQTGCPIDNATFNKLKSEASQIRPVKVEAPAEPAE